MTVKVEQLLETKIYYLIVMGSVISYDPVCPSVGRSTCRLVSQSVGLSKRAGSYTSMLLSEHLFIYFKTAGLKKASYAAARFLSSTFWFGATSSRWQRTNFSGVFFCCVP